MTVLDENCKTIHIVQGQHEVGNKPDLILSSVLGSCVAACLYDPVAKIGGMNHFLLPERSGDRSSKIICGAQSMELLINAMLKRGAQKSRFVAKLFGGAQIRNGLTNVGLQNAEFASNFMRIEGIQIVSASLGSTNGRRVRFWPATGRASMKLLESAEPVQTKPVVIRAPEPQVELF